MENIFVEFLPPWVETGMQPAFYDKESGTVLQQTARMYARVNMLIRMFNKLSKETKETVEEYITKFNDLHDYVHDYFENLDVQEEINNKLDQMAEDGTLQEIITTYIQANVAWTFDTVADMKSATNLINGSYAQTLGYNTINDGGGALYYITDSVESNEIQEELGDGLYATLTNVHTEGYIDLRWLGADSTGVTGCADIVKSALLYSNNHYLKPIKVVGKFYIEKAISLVGSIAMFGMHVPGTERFLYEQETSSYTVEPVSQFILNNNITAINLTGIGSTTLNASVLNIKNIDITEKSNSKTSTFIDVNAFGGPSRPNVIKEVSAHGINTLLSAVHILTETYTNLMLLDIGSINCYGCGTVLNFPTLSSNNEGLMNLNLHDSVIEQSDNIVLESLGCYNQIKSNLFEGLTGTTSIKVKKAASLDFIGNYFELNTGDVVFDTYATYSDSEVTDMPFIRFENNTIINVSNNYIFKNCAVSFNAYNTNNMIFYNSVIKLDSTNYSYIRTRLNSLINSKTSTEFNHIRFKDTIYTTDNTQELSDGKYAYGSSFATDKYIVNGVTTWKLAGNAGETLSNDYISVQANDYVGLLFYKSSNGNSSSLQISLIDGNGIGRAHIHSRTSPYDGYYLYITKVDTTTGLNVYVKNRRDNDVYISPIKMIDFGQDLTADVMQYLTLYK